jgi:hypothetical protein
VEGEPGIHSEVGHRELSRGIAAAIDPRNDTDSNVSISMITPLRTDQHS